MIRVEHVEQIGGTSIMAFAAEAWVALLHDGTMVTPGLQCVSWDESAVVAYEEGRLGPIDPIVPIGLITHDPHRRQQRQQRQR